MSGAQLDGDDIARLEAHLAGVFEADGVRMAGHAKLGGGAIQQNWSIDLDVDGGPRAGRLALVLRTDSPTQVAISASRVEEYRLLCAARAAGVTVPEPLHCCTDIDVLGRPFVLMRRVAGTALGPKVVKDTTLGGDREALTERLGGELARIHAMTPDTHDFAFLPAPSATPARAELARMRAHLDDLHSDHPSLEWGAAWLAANAPDTETVVLAHHDFRTGNYMVDDHGLTAILDWEFAGWSDPHEDIGWFCAMCWRFSRRDLEAGGIGSREAFYRGYRDEGGPPIDGASVYWWEVYAHLRWAIIALQQGERYLRGGERTLVLGLTGRRTVEMELELLRMTRPDTIALETRS